MLLEALEIKVEEAEKIINALSEEKSEGGCPGVCFF